MSRTKFGVLAALVLLAIMVVTAPARVILPFLPGDRVLLQGVSGSLWQGASSRALVALQGSYLHLGRLTWSLAPMSLLTLGPRLELDSRWGGQLIQGDVVYHSANSLELSSVEAVFPAALVRQFIPLELSGSFSLLLEHLVIDEGMPVQGNGRIVWQDGGWLSPQGKRRLGSYAIDFEQPEGGSGLLGEVVTLAGELQASGDVSLEGNNYTIDIVLSGQGLEDPQLQQALQLVAIPEGDRFRVKMQGSF